MHAHHVSVLCSLWTGGCYTRCLLQQVCFVCVFVFSLHAFNSIIVNLKVFSCTNLLLLCFGVIFDIINMFHFVILHN